MRVTHVLTAVNANPEYTKFVPLFLQQWKQFYGEITPIIVYIGDSIPTQLEPYREYLRLFPPVGQLSTVATAQIIRILYPCLLPDDAVILITDMDMLPGKSAYFQQAASMIPDHVFGSLRPKTIVAANQIAICYNVARASTWRSIFGIHTPADIVHFLESNVPAGHDGQHGGRGWYSDQELLYTRVSEWQQKGGNVVFLNDSDTSFRRLDHYHHNYNPDIFAERMQHYYADCHIYAHKCPWNEEQIAHIMRLLQVHSRF
jgi:hypothetical protein